MSDLIIKELNIKGSKTSVGHCIEFTKGAATWITPAFINFDEDLTIQEEENGFVRIVTKDLRVLMRLLNNSKVEVFNIELNK